MDLSTIAKPYANAIFAIAEQNESHATWKATLEAGAQLAKDTSMQAFIATPKVTKTQKSDVLVSLLRHILGRALSAEETALMSLLLSNGRIEVLPSLLALFVTMTNAGSDTKVCEVISAHQLSVTEQKKIAHDLSDKYQTSVSVNTEVDESLIGGVVIKQGDKVVDTSIQARVDALGLCLSSVH